MKLRRVEGNGRCYVVLNDREAQEIGVRKEKEITVRGYQRIPVFKLPATCQPARVRYTPDEVIRIAELILAGGRWCEYKHMHFLIVLPWCIP
jgi:hypothetical protein